MSGLDTSQLASDIALATISYRLMLSSLPHYSLIDNPEDHLVVDC
jgi:hypothetical protein